MEKKTLNIPNITCNHCVMTIKNELGELEGILGVEGTADTKNIVVDYDAPATLEKIKALLEEIHYPAA
jgi:copper chaperone